MTNSLKPYAYVYGGPDHTDPLCDAVHVVLCRKGMYQAYVIRPDGTERESTEGAAMEETMRMPKDMVRPLFDAIVEYIKNEAIQGRLL